MAPNVKSERRRRAQIKVLLGKQKDTVVEAYFGILDGYKPGVTKTPEALLSLEGNVFPENIQVTELQIFIDSLNSMKVELDRYSQSIDTVQEFEELSEEEAIADEHFQEYIANKRDYEKYLSCYKILEKAREEYQHHLEAQRKQLEQQNAQTENGAVGRHQRIDTGLKPGELAATASIADFRTWRKGFEDYFNSNQMVNLSARDQRAHLRSCLSPEVIRTMEILLGIGDDEKVEDVLGKLQKHYSEVINLMTRRVHFQRCTQKPGEKFSDYFVRLRMLGDDAELDCLSYDDRLAGQIVCTASNPDLQAELLKLKDHSLAAVKATCLAWESAEDNQQALQEEPSVTVAATSTYQKLKKQRKEDKTSPRKQKSFKRCSRCGREQHEDNQKCPARDKECFSCGKTGHFAGVCRSKVEEDNENCDSEIAVKTVTLQGGRSAPKATVTIKKGRQSPFKVDVHPDTGADESLIPAHWLKKYGIRIDKAKQRLIRAAGGVKLRCLGATTLDVKWLHHRAIITAYVTPDIRDSMLSWHALVKLGMIPETFPYSPEDAHRYSARAGQAVPTTSKEGRMGRRWQKRMPSQAKSRIDKWTWRSKGSPTEESHGREHLRKGCQARLVRRMSPGQSGEERVQTPAMKGQPQC